MSLVEELGLLYSVLLVSGVLFAAIALYLAIRTRRAGPIAGTLLGLAAAAWIVYTVMPSPTTSRSAPEEASGATLVISYIAMVLGMVAHYAYAQAEKGARTLTIEWLPFLMPILASPIVFIPLVSIAGETPSAGGAFTRAKLMIYLVAFQNGFFWKHFFDQRKPAN